MPSPIRLIFLPGMAARGQMWEEVTRRLSIESATTDVWEWIPPVGNETLVEYAARWVAHHRRGDEEQTIVVGASFGGIVGQEVAKLLDADALVLVGSVRRRKDLPLWMRVIAPFRWLVRLVPWRVVQSLAKTTTPLWRPIAGQDLALVIDEFGRADAKLLGWSILRILGWNPSVAFDGPTTAIHGTKDRLLPMDLNEVDVVVPGGGHVLPISNAGDIADILGRLVSLIRRR